MALHVFFVLFNYNHQVALRLSWNGSHMYFHRTVRDRAATVWRRCSVGVDVVVDHWRGRHDVEGGGRVRLLGRFIKQKR